MGITPPKKLLALAVLPALVVFVPGCRKASAPTGPQYIMLMYNAGDCNQNGSTGIIDVYANQPVIYQGATAQSEFQISFAKCPLAADYCPVNSPNGISVNVGQPLASAEGSTFMYTSMKIDNQPCNGARSMGVRVLPSP
jgi:hypothetical protein